MTLSQTKTNISINLKFSTAQKESRKTFGKMSTFGLMNELVYSLLMISHESDQKRTDYLLVYLTFK